MKKSARVSEKLVSPGLPGLQVATRLPWCIDGYEKVELKKSLKTALVLQFLDPNTPILMSCDASKFELGEIDLKLQDDNELPVTMALQQ